MKLWFLQPKNREKVIRLYIHHRNIYMKGSAEFGFLKSTINWQSGMVWWLFLKSIWPEIPFVVGVVGFFMLFVLRGILNWVLGAWWDKEDMFSKESDWSNRRNPVLNGLDEKVLKA